MGAAMETAVASVAASSLLNAVNKAKARVSAQAAQDASAERPANAALDRRGGPVGQGEYVARQGDTLASIAAGKGHLWRTIWDDAANSELVNQRQDPNVLLPEDRVTIPPLEAKSEPGQTELRHRFVRRGEPAAIAIVFRDKQGRPRSNEAYEIEIDGVATAGFTDPEGVLRMPVSGQARRGRVTLTKSGECVPLRFGHLDPIESVSGVQGRLNNIGFRCGAIDGRWSRRTQVALRLFQLKHRLTVTGECDESTRAKLREVHGS